MSQCPGAWANGKADSHRRVTALNSQTKPSGIAQQRAGPIRPQMAVIRLLSGQQTSIGKQDTICVSATVGEPVPGLPSRVVVLFFSFKILGILFFFPLVSR